MKRNPLEKALDKVEEKYKQQQKEVTKKTLKEKNTDGAFLFCPVCASEYSADTGDYFMLDDSHVFVCCDENSLLMTKSTSYKEV